MMFSLAIIFLLYSHYSSGQKFLHNQTLPFIHDTIATKPVQNDADDPAIWIHPKNPELSLLMATDKKADVGGLYVFDLEGNILQRFDNISRPNNVDVEYGFKINDSYSIDLAVLTERNKQCLRIYSIDSNARRLNELTGGNTAVFTNYTNNEASPMGIGLYKRANDSKIYAVVSRKNGPRDAYLGQYELVWNGHSIDLQLVRFFGDFEGAEVESIVIDDSLGHIYYSDEKFGIRKYNVDPLTTEPKQLGFIDTKGIWYGDSEGIALYEKSDNKGYLILTDQIASGSIFHIYERQGNNTYVSAIKTRAVKTDGIDATSANLNSYFPNGLLIVMNEIDKNYLVYDWRDIEKGLNHFQNAASNNHQTCLIFSILTTFILRLLFF